MDCKTVISYIKPTILSFYMFNIWNGFPIYENNSKIGKFISLIGTDNVQFTKQYSFCHYVVWNNNLNNKTMVDEVITNEEFDDLNTFYYVAKDEENDFYWVLNLDDHPNSFLLDKSFQHLVPSKIREGNESMVIKQPLPPM